MQIDAKQHQHSAAAAAKVILYQSAGELSLLVQYTTDLHLGRQIISKCLFGVFNFFQKNEQKHVAVVKTNSFVHFLEEFTA